VVPIDSARCAAVGDALSGILSAFTPLLQPLEPGQVVCDLSGSERLWPETHTLARTVQAAVQEKLGIVPAIGIGANRLVAELASAAPGPDGVTIVKTGEERSFLADIPLASLPEVDAQLALTFQILGLITAAQLAALPALAVRHRFGPLGERLHRYACGIDPRPITPPPSRPIISATYDCDEGTPEEALEGLLKLAEEVGGELQRRNLQARMVTIRLTYALPERSSRTLPRRDTPALPTGPTADGAPGSAPTWVLPCPESPAEGRSPRLPIRYRIHSYALPQPNGGDASMPVATTPPSTKRTHLPPPANNTPLPAKRTHFPSPAKGTDETVTTLVRTPLGAAAPLAERARHLLLTRLKAHRNGRAPTIEHVELEVSEFARPEQLGFAGLALLGETDLSPERREILHHGDDAWISRYGHTPFRHVKAIDPANVVTERRVRWAEGLRTPRRRR
jgi:nucleotidyltransferase/DNA polymerase involved in DNA repair